MPDVQEQLDEIIYRMEMLNLKANHGDFLDPDDVCRAFVGVSVAVTRLATIVKEHLDA